MRKRVGIILKDSTRILLREGLVLFRKILFMGHLVVRRQAGLGQDLEG